MKWWDKALMVIFACCAMVLTAAFIDQAFAATSVKQGGALQYLLDLLWWLGAAGGRG